MSSSWKYSCLQATAQHNLRQRKIPESPHPDPSSSTDLSRNLPYWAGKNFSQNIQIDKESLTRTAHKKFKLIGNLSQEILTKNTDWCRTFHKTIQIGWEPLLLIFFIDPMCKSLACRPSTQARCGETGKLTIRITKCGENKTRRRKTF